MLCVGLALSLASLAQSSDGPRPFATVGVWQVFSRTLARGGHACWAIAETAAPTSGLALFFDELGQFKLGFIPPGSTVGGPREVLSFTVDGVDLGTRTLTQVSEGVFAMPLAGDALIEALTKGASLVVRGPNGSASFSLGGSAQVVDTLHQCLATALPGDTP